MKFRFIIILLTIASYNAECQISNQQTQVDTLLARKLTIAGFCLCKTTLRELKNLDTDLKEVDVEEMDLCKGGFVLDGRFVNRKGYYSKKYPGMIFQKDNDNDFISKIRLTKDFVGKLPDGTPVNMNTILAKDILSFYPNYNTWKSRGCSDYWNLTNDTLAFFVKIDKNKKPQYPIDEAYYLSRPIDGIDLVISCYSIYNNANDLILLPADEPLMFLDSIRINKGVLNSYKPDEIAMVSVLKDSNAIKVAGKEATNGAIYITTKSFARDSYWNYFKLKSIDYQKSVPDLNTEANVVYILNNKVLKSNFEADLFNINDLNLIELSVISKDELKNYNLKGKSIGVIIKTITK